MKLSRRQVLKTSSLAVAVALGSLWGLPFGDRAAGPAGVTLRFAVIGDYGWVPGNPGSVASLVRTWSPDFVVTTGDNNYRCGEASTIDANIGQFYHDFIFPYRGTYGSGATVNRFFPTLGNHDWGGGSGIAPGLTECRGGPSWGRLDRYLAYFQLPGNNRYYDVQQGPVHLFFLDSDGREPDSNTSDSVQAQWLQARLAASTAPWKLVFFHHPPYSAGYQGTFSLQGPWMRWPFKAWGASAVLSGHAHSYERIVLGGFPYFVNGLGGAGITSLG